MYLSDLFAHTISRDDKAFLCLDHGVERSRQSQNLYIRLVRALSNAPVCQYSRTLASSCVAPPQHDRNEVGSNSTATVTSRAFTLYRNGSRRFEDRGEATGSPQGRRVIYVVYVFRVASIKPNNSVATTLMMSSCPADEHVKLSPPSAIVTKFPLCRSASSTAAMRKGVVAAAQDMLQRTPCSHHW